MGHNSSVTFFKGRLRFLVLAVLSLFYNKLYLSLHKIRRFLSSFLSFSPTSSYLLAVRTEGYLLHLLIFSDTHTYTQYEPSGRRIGPSQRPLPDSTRHSQEIDIHASDGIGIRDSSKRTAAVPTPQIVRPSGPALILNFHFIY